MPKTIAQLQAEIERTEKKIAGISAKSAEKKKLREMKTKLFKLKHHREIEIARGAAKGLSSLAKALNRGYKALQEHERKIEARERKG